MVALTVDLTVVERAVKTADPRAAKKASSMADWKVVEMDVLSAAKKADSMVALTVDLRVDLTVVT